MNNKNHSRIFHAQSVLILVVLAVAINCFAANFATASIDVTAFNFMKAFAVGTGSEGQGVGDEETLNGPTFPGSGSVNALAGASYSDNDFNLFTAGEQTVLSFDSTHFRSRSQAGFIVDSLQFTADANMPFTLSGFYQGLNSEASAGQATYQVHLIHDGVGTMFRHAQQSVNESADFTLGVPAAHPILIDTIEGSPTGNLIAGHSYTLYYSASTIQYGLDNGSTTIGNLSLTVGPPQDYLLTVEYQTPEVTGPLIEGFDPIPQTVTAKFLLDDVILGANPIGLDQVLSFELDAPGLNPTAADLDYFQLTLDASGTPTGLNWGFGEPAIIITNNNFTLSISGTDPGTEEDFSYFWGESVNSFEIATPGDFDLDGDVDGRDFLAWQRGESPEPLTDDDLAVWQSNYGAPGLSVFSVPEPTCFSIVLFLAGVSLCGPLRWGRWRWCVAPPDVEAPAEPGAVRVKQWQ